jgi:hypothetical protein
MSKSARVRFADLKKLYEIAIECRELGDDPKYWRLHWYQRLSAMIGADLALGGELSGLQTGEPVAIGVAEWGWGNGLKKEGWERALHLMESDARYNLAFRGYAKRLREQDGVALSVLDFVDKADWYKSLEYDEVHRLIGVDHTMWCATAIPNTNKDSNSVCFCRAAGERDFSGRDKAIVAEAHAIIKPWIGGRLSKFGGRYPSQLTPTQRRVLAHLLEGASDLEVADRLEMTRSTVNKHIHAILNHFCPREQVASADNLQRSRSKLLARWGKHGWCGRRVWAEGSPPISG